MKRAKRLLLAAMLLAMLADRTAAGAPAEPDAAQVDAIVRKLEASGALDAAVERAIERYVKRSEQARESQEQQRYSELARRARPVDRERDHIRGPLAAEISLIEYTDFECPFCKRFHDTPKALLARYGARINWVLRDFPLQIHDPAARNEALAGECVARLAGNDAYWRYADAVFAHTKSNGAGLPPGYSIEKLAADAAIKAPALKQCMGEAATASRLEADLAEGTAIGVTGTPTTVIRNNRTGAARAVVGARPVEALAPVIDQLLGEAKPQ